MFGPFSSENGTTVPCDRRTNGRTIKGTQMFDCYRKGGRVMEAKRWTVEIHITEEGPDTVAQAVLSTRDTKRLTGMGRARRNPADRDVPEIGDEYAASRALADLAAQLSGVAREDVAQMSGPA
jgi:hypothetical protein